MYDVFRSLSGSPVESISATAISPGSNDLLRNDNFVATLRYEDGSVATLTYTAVGPKQGLPKERLEVFCDGQAFVLDDYKQLIQAGADEPLWSGETDKGHLTELTRLGEAIRDGQGSPISPREIFETTAVSLRIEDLIFGRFNERTADVLGQRECR